MKRREFTIKIIEHKNSVKVESYPTDELQKAWQYFAKMKDEKEYEVDMFNALVLQFMSTIEKVREIGALIDVSSEK
jgi:hypothetical protein